MIQLCEMRCPNGHCIIAAAYEPHEDPKDVERKLRERLTQVGHQGLCFICGSRQTAYEHRPTLFDTIQQAVPYLYARAFEEAFAKVAEQQRRNTFN